VETLLVIAISAIQRGSSKYNWCFFPKWTFEVGPLL
jgi:hypothetical protein